MREVVERRERDHKRAKEKKIQRMNDRTEIEGGEVFVTETYLKKKQEEKEIEKAEREED